MFRTKNLNITARYSMHKTRHALQIALMTLETLPIQYFTNCFLQLTCVGQLQTVQVAVLQHSRNFPLDLPSANEPGHELCDDVVVGSALLLLGLSLHFARDDPLQPSHVRQFGRFGSGN